MNAHRCILLLLVFLLSIACISYDTKTDSKKWTVMLYWNGDDPLLERDFIDAFVKLANTGTGSNEDVNIVIQLDRIPENDTSYGNWTIANRYFFQANMLPTMDNAIQDWGDSHGGREVKMDSPETLTNFIEWGKSNYPADKYVLVVADHGFGWQGLSIDATSNENFMFLPELKQAVINAGVAFELIALDACLMQTIEVAYELKECHANVMIGSQNPGSTWPFWVFLPELLQTPAMTTDQLCTLIVDSYSDWQSSNENATLASLDFNKFDLLIPAVDDFITTLTDGSPKKEIQNSAFTVMNKIKETILYNKSHGEWESIAYGLSIYFPEKTTLYRPELFGYYYIGKMTAFAEDMGWRDFLNSFYNPMGSKQHIQPFIYDIRKEMKTFIASENIDLFEFCKRITALND